MYARTSTWTGSPEALERWASHVVERVAPMVAQLPGNLGAHFLVDRAGGSALTVTLWESEEAARASDEAAERSRASTIAATGVELVQRGRFEVLAHHDRIDANKRLSQRFTELFSTGDESLAEEVLGPDVVFHGTRGDGEICGIEAMKAFVAAYRTTFPDARSTVEAQVGEGDTVATRWRARGTRRQQVDLAGPRPPRRSHPRRDDGRGPGVEPALPRHLPAARARRRAARRSAAGRRLLGLHLPAPRGRDGVLGRRGRLRPASGSTARGGDPHRHPRRERRAVARRRGSGAPRARPGRLVRLGHGRRRAVAARARLPRPRPLRRAARDPGARRAAAAPGRPRDRAAQDPHAHPRRSLGGPACLPPGEPRGWTPSPSSSSSRRPRRWRPC